MASKFEQFADGLAALALERDHLVVHLADGPETSVAVAEIVMVETELHGVRLVLANGSELVTRPMDTLVTLGARLARHSRFVRANNTQLINLEYVNRIRPVVGGTYELLLEDDRVFELTMGFEAVKAYFGLASLEHVVPWNARLAAIVAEKLRTFEKDIRMMTDEEIRANFSTADGTQLVLREIVGNVLWQAYNWIHDGRLDPIEGNIRSLWYSHIKPLLARFYPMGDNLYKDLTETFSDYVGRLHIFRYADFGLIDDSGGMWQVGEKYPTIIVCAEKQGHWKPLQDLAAETGVTIIALGGQPSLMTTEFLVDGLLAKGVDPTSAFHLITDVDYDPSGNIIAKSFMGQLDKMGIQGAVERLDVIQPENFTPDEVKYFRVPVAALDKSSKSKTATWLDKRKSPFGGGLPGPDGQPVADGLESDAMPRSRRHDLIVSAIQAIVAAPAGEPWPTTRDRIEQSWPRPHSVWDGYEKRIESPHGHQRTARPQA